MAKVIYANCSVKYDGRANSFIDNTNLIIFIKDDNSIAVHNGLLTPPINYLSAGANIMHNDKHIKAAKNNEELCINYNELYWINDVLLGNESPVIINTERDLVNKIVRNITSYIKYDIIDVCTEVDVGVGKVDILVFTNINTYIIEVKRTKVSTPHVSQVKRYVDEYSKICDVVGILAAPDIGAKAEKYANSMGIGFWKIGFDNFDNGEL